jgi:hypothetical protein
MSGDSTLPMKRPAPERGKVSLWSLGVSLALPPLAWSLQSVLGYSVSSEACYPGDTPLSMPDFSGLWWLLLGINVLALVIIVLAMSIAHRNWKLTRQELGGDSQHLIERGEGRSRFLSMCGLMLGGGLAVATLFSTVTLAISPLCR